MSDDKKIILDVIINVDKLDESVENKLQQINALSNQYNSSYYAYLSDYTYQGNDISTAKLSVYEDLRFWSDNLIAEGTIHKGVYNPSNTPPKLPQFIDNSQKSFSVLANYDKVIWFLGFVFTVNIGINFYERIKNVNL